MNLLGEIVEYLQTNHIILSLIEIVLFIIVIIYTFRINRKLQKYRFLSRESEDKSLEELLLKIAEKSQDNNNRVVKLEEEFVKNLAIEERHVQKIGLVRFQAFENTGGDQSFALSMMDAKGNGVVISSLFGRDESRVYCKPVTDGKSTYPLSKEEKEAINKALGIISKE